MNGNDKVGKSEATGRARLSSARPMVENSDDLACWRRAEDRRALPRFAGCSVFLASLLIAMSLMSGRAAERYEVFVSNEKEGTLTVIDGSSQEAVATIPVGKRPRGVRATPDGKHLYVAVSGTPISAPPQLDAKGNPIFKKGKDDDDDDDKKADKSADGIAIVDVAQRKLLRKIKVGSDPEQ